LEKSLASTVDQIRSAIHGEGQQQDERKLRSAEDRAQFEIQALNLDEVESRLRQGDRLIVEFRPRIELIANGDAYTEFLYYERLLLNAVGLLETDDLIEGGLEGLRSGGLAPTDVIVRTLASFQSQEASEPPVIVPEESRRRRRWLGICWKVLGGTLMVGADVTASTFVRQWISPWSEAVSAALGNALLAVALSDWLSRPRG
jgi:hypothetical protein